VGARKLGDYGGAVLALVHGEPVEAVLGASDDGPADPGPTQSDDPA
jgi:hypothetical protein